MAVTVDQLAYELRLSTGEAVPVDDPEYASLKRSLDAANESVKLYGDAAPESVQEMATIILAKYLHDVPIGDRTTWAFPLRNSGALAMLAPWRAHRALALGGEAGAAAGGGVAPVPGAGGDGITAAEVQQLIDAAIASIPSSLPAITPHDVGRLLRVGSDQAAFWDLVQDVLREDKVAPVVARLVELTRDLHTDSAREWVQATGATGIALTANVSGLPANTYAARIAQPEGGWDSTIRYAVARLPLGATVGNYRVVWEARPGSSGRDDLEYGNNWEHLLDDDTYSYYSTSAYNPFNDRLVHRFPEAPGADVVAFQLQHDATVERTRYDGIIGILPVLAAATRGKLLAQSKTSEEYVLTDPPEPASGGAGGILGSFWFRRPITALKYSFVTTFPAGATHIYILGTESSNVVLDRRGAAISGIAVSALQVKAVGDSASGDNGATLVNGRRHNFYMAKTADDPPQFLMSSTSTNVDYNIRGIIV